MSEMNVEERTISPQLAKKWLDDHNKSNRKLRPRKVKAYAEQMSRGQWMNEGDTYRFDINGTLLDGQHRLAAMVEANYTAKKAVVITGLAPETYRILDSGMLRTPGDALGMGVAAATHKASAIRLIYVYELEGDPRRTEDLGIVTRTDLAEWHDQHAEEISYAVKTADRLYNLFAGGNRSAWSAFVLLSMRASAPHAEEFLEGVMSGANLIRGDIRLTLRNWLSNDRKLPNAGAHLGMLIKAWNLWMAGASRANMVFREDEAFPRLTTRKVVGP